MLAFSSFRVKYISLGYNANPLVQYTSSPLTQNVPLPNMDLFHSIVVHPFPFIHSTQTYSSIPAKPNSRTSPSSVQVAVKVRYFRSQRFRKNIILKFPWHVRNGIRSVRSQLPEDGRELLSYRHLGICL